MRVTVVANVLTVVSDISESTIKKGMTDLTAYDDKKNPLYKVAVDEAGNGKLGQFGMTANTYVDGMAAVVIVEPIGTTKEDIKRKYGKAVVAAQKYCPIIAAAATSEEELIDTAFGDCATAEPATAEPATTE